MRSGELMLRDLVQVNGEAVKVISISYFDIGISDRKNNFYHEHIDNIEPIPLTAEILEKNGWRKHEVLLNGNKYMFGGDGVLPLLLKHTNQKKYPGFYDNQITIKYVHEFQHWAKLCGIEKEIEI